MKKWLTAVALGLSLGAGSLMAQTGEVMTNGEVRRIDKGGGRITLRHEEIKSLDMPPMTMVFRVSDPAMLDQVKVGDKVKFTAQDLKGAITLMKLEPVR